MGKKTKKQKMRALEHKIHALEHAQHVHIQVPEVKRETKPTISNMPSVKEKQTKVVQFVKSDEDKKLRKYFISDFRKSIALVTAVIAVEIALYFIL